MSESCDTMLAVRIGIKTHLRDYLEYLDGNALAFDCCKILSTTMRKRRYRG